MRSDVSVCVYVNENKGIERMATARELFDAAFETYRDLRSAAYREGALAALRYRLGEAEHLRQPHQLGTAEADAWFAGSDEGNCIARQYLSAQKGR